MSGPHLEIQRHRSDGAPSVWECVVATVEPQLRRYDAQRGGMFVNALVERLRDLPGIEAVSVGPPTFFGASGGGIRWLEVEGQKRALPERLALYVVHGSPIQATRHPPRARQRAWVTFVDASGRVQPRR